MGRRVSVVLISWNSARWLPSSLASLAAQRGVDVELIVVDNASTDGSLDLVRRHFPSARIIANATNRGFAAAANQGIGASSEVMVFLLNPDVRLDPDHLSKLTEALETAGDDYGVATGTLLQGEGEEITPTGRIDSLGIAMSRSGRHLDIRQGEPAEDLPDVPVEVFGVSAAAALYRRSFLDDVAIEGEYFDERFFAYREDADLAWRGRILGWRALHVPAAVGWHVRRVTPAARRSLPPEINCHSVKNRFLLRINNQGAGLALRHLPWQLLRDAMVAGGVVLFERTSLPAFRWLWQNRRGLLARRRLIQQRRRVSEGRIARWFR
jgi:GT2 family glycosyltransferase